MSFDKHQRNHLDPFGEYMFLLRLVLSYLVGMFEELRLLDGMTEPALRSWPTPQSHPPHCS